MRSKSIRKNLAAAFLAIGLALAGTAAAADLQSGLAQFNHGDYKAAFATLKPLADKGDVSAQYAMGLSYYSGLGTTKNLPEAMKWFRLAAGQGLAQAEYCLGVMYAHGEGVPVNFGTAIEWYRKAASKGYGPAYHNLGTMNANGDGVFGNLTLALAYFMVAADLGVPEAVAKRDELAHYLGKTTAARAREKANGFKAAIRRGIAPPLPVIDPKKPAVPPAASDKDAVQIQM